jgi:hypothetical protein
MLSIALPKALYGALWVVTVVNSLVLVALVRQVGIVLLRVGQVAPSAALGGPRVGETINLPEQWARRSSAGAAYRLVIFVSLNCGTCERIVPAANSVAKGYPAFQVMLIGDEDPGELAKWARTNGARVPVLAIPGTLAANGIPGTPFACFVDGNDVVIRAAGVNHLDHLETLIASFHDLDRQRQAQVAGDDSRGPQPISLLGGTEEG